MSNIVNNTGVNYSNYYNLLNYIAEIMSGHPSLAAVGNDELDELDNKQFPSYPIGNIIVDRVTFGETTTDYDMLIIIADKQKEKNNESVGERNLESVPLFGTDDTQDILANTLAITNDITSVIQRGIQNFDITNAINCVQFKDRFNNGLAGWEVTFTLTTHNDKNRCLFELYPN